MVVWFAVFVESHYQLWQRERRVFNNLVQQVIVSIFSNVHAQGKRNLLTRRLVSQGVCNLRHKGRGRVRRGRLIVVRR